VYIEAERKLSVSLLVDSKQKKLSPEEIVKIAAKETGGKYTADQIKASLSAEANQMKALMFREGNTIFVVHQTPAHPDIAVFRAINADTIPRYMANSVMFTKAMGLAGFHVMITQFDNASLLNIFKFVKRQAPFKGMGYQVGRAKNGEYVVTVNLGDTKAKK
jgi:hypothetical protein